jgi:lysophospholipase L1-like esterase
MNVNKSLLLLLFSLLAITPCHFQITLAANAQGKTEPPLMAVLGDSISAGTLADTTLSWPDLKYSPISHEQAAQDVASRMLWENKSTLSWASGSLIQSHFTHLKNALHSKDLDIRNLAIPGSKAMDLLKQVDQLVVTMESGAYSELIYVTLLIGSNDACSSQTEDGTPNDQMLEGLFSALKRVAQIKQDSPIHILVAGIPRIPDLGKKEIRDTTTLGGLLTCATLRSYINNCSLLSWETEADYQKKLQIVEAKNDVIRMAVEKASDAFKNLDIVFSNSPFQAVLTADLLAADCFHPNKIGQEQFAEGLWGDQPWFD